MKHFIAITFLSNCVFFFFLLIYFVLLFPICDLFFCVIFFNLLNTFVFYIHVI